MASAASSLKQIGAIPRVERGGHVTVKLGLKLQDPAGSNGRRFRIAKAHRSRSTPKAAVGAARLGISQVDDLRGVHGEEPFSVVGKTYDDGESMSSTSKCKKLHIPHAEVDAALGSIIRRKPVKTVSTAAGRSDDTVKKWRVNTLPETFTALLNLIAADDEIYDVVMELSGRNGPSSLNARQKGALREIVQALGVK